MTIRRYLFVMLSVALSSTLFAMSPGPSESDSIAIPDYPLMINGGPGIVISASVAADQLPEADRNFIGKYYPQTSIAKSNVNFIKGTASVSLSDGTKIEFGNGGVVNDIKAPEGKALPESVVEAVLPERASHHLRQVNALSYVNAIKNAHGRGFCVMQLNDNPPQLIYDIDGLFIVAAG